MATSSQQHLACSLNKATLSCVLLVWIRKLYLYMDPLLHLQEIIISGNLSFYFEYKDNLYVAYNTGSCGWIIPQTLKTF